MRDEDDGVDNDYSMNFPVGLGHMAGYLKGPQFPGQGPPALTGPFGLGHTLDHSPYGVEHFSGELFSSIYFPINRNVVVDGFHSIT
ncbi:hypothetical protein Phum_PHUM363340 [Pediculus humanus corporis]|uniref:Uncharacterized protein n=1 Tax=Pediculus humanus subsp. corporis TaxID=121224 RepID=E0VPR7_PEDHC|nr:uncharacterized protein Phum_PHUM363340 [Pediculus humanus corporis]EEB15373.1 hypothetical protein Phum_PHUM363340 [Pediculus humanus corporis]